MKKSEEIIQDLKNNGFEYISGRWIYKTNDLEIEVWIRDLGNVSQEGHWYVEARGKRFDLIPGILFFLMEKTL